MPGQVLAAEGGCGAPMLSPDLILVQIRLPRELVREIDHLAIDLDEYRAPMFAMLLREALDARRTAGKERAHDIKGGA